MTTEVIYKEYGSMMRSFLKMNRLDDNTVDDILQNVFLKIHADVNKLDRIGNLRAWLYRMTKNMMIDYFRSQNFNKEISDDLPSEEEQEPVIQNVASSIRFFINQLEEPYKRTLILSELRGKSQIEISKDMNIPYSTVKSRIQRGRNMVKKMMLDCCHYEFDRRGSVIDYNCRKC